MGMTRAETRCIPSCKQPDNNSAQSKHWAGMGLFEETAKEGLINESDHSDNIAEYIDSVYERNTRSVTEFPSDQRNTSNKTDERDRDQKEKLSSSEVLNQSEHVSRPKMTHLNASKVSDQYGSYTTNNSLGGANIIKYSVLPQSKVATSFRSRRRRRKRSTQIPDSRATWSGFRWNAEDDALSSGQHELKLTSSTFALTGDSAHNQAMVHWSGQNSSVSETHNEVVLCVGCQ